MNSDHCTINYRQHRWIHYKKLCVGFFLRRKMICVHFVLSIASVESWHAFLCSFLVNISNQGNKFQAIYLLQITAVYWPGTSQILRWHTIWPGLSQSARGYTQHLRYCRYTLDLIAHNTDSSEAREDKHVTPDLRWCPEDHSLYVWSGKTIFSSFWGACKICPEHFHVCLVIE